MAVITKGTTFANGDQVTAGSLNNLVDNAAFDSGAVDNVSTQLSGGAVIVKDGGVGTAKIADNSVTTAKIADAQITTAKIADAQVVTAKIADAQITTAKIANSNVTTAKIANSNVTTEKIADDAVSTAKLPDSAVTTAKINDGAVTTAKINDSAVTTAKINDSAVTTAKIADSNVTTAKIANSNVTTAKIANSNVTKAKIENVANMKVLGNTSGSATAPQEVSILDEDNMSSNSATALATQQSIKAYVDSQSTIVPFGRLRIKLPPSDFIHTTTLRLRNDGAYTDLDGSASNNDFSFYVSTDIPEGYRATGLTALGKDINFGAWEGNISNSQSATSLGTSFDNTGNGATINFSVTGNATNYISVGVSDRSGNGYFYGAYITLQKV